MVGGKKLWEVLITDANGSFRLCETLPSNKVNSRELRRVVDDAIESAEVKPNTVRFFRGAMFNMVRSIMRVFNVQLFSVQSMHSNSNDCRLTLRCQRLT